MADAETKVVVTAQTIGVNSALKEVETSIKELVAPIEAFKKSISGIVEAVSAAFAVEKIAEFVDKISEAAETAVNMAAALGMTAEQYTVLSEQFRLVGGNAESAVQVFRMLSNAIQTAQNINTSRQAQAFDVLGISVNEFARKLRGTPEEVEQALVQLDEAFARWKAVGGNTGVEGPFGVLLGRNPAGALALLNEGFVKTKTEVEGLGPPTQDELEHLKEMEKQVHSLGIAFDNLKTSILAGLADPIQGALKFLTDLIRTLGDFKDKWGLKREDYFPKPGEPGGGPATPGASQQSYDAARSELNSDEFSRLSNKEKIRLWLYANGYNDAATAAIIGNIEAESDFNPATSYKGHFGLLQWDPERQKPLGGSTDISTQMELMDRELAKLDPAFKTAAGSAAELAGRFEKVFERSGGQAEARREAAATKAAGETTLTDVGVTALAPGATAPDPRAWDISYEAVKKYWEEYLKGMEEAKKLQDEKYKGDLIAARGDEALKNEITQKMVAADQEYYAKRKALIDQMPSYLQGKFSDEAAAASASANKGLEATVRAENEKIAAAEKTLQHKLKLDEQAEAADLRSAQAQAKIYQQSASQLLAIEEEIVARHKAQQDQILADEQVAADGRKKILQTVEDERIALKQKTDDQIRALREKAMEEEAADARKIDDKIASDFSEIFDAALSGNKAGIGQAIERVLRSQIEGMIANVFKSAVESTGIGASLSGTPLGMLFGGAGNIFGGGGGGSADFSGGEAGIGGEVASAGEGFGIGKLFGWLFGLLPKFSQGGIVPTAQGGWSLPNFSGMQLAGLHANEMVLPSGISQGLQNMIASGGGGHTVNVYSQAMDGPSAHRAIMALGPSIVASINKAQRLGSSLNTA